MSLYHRHDHEWINKVINEVTVLKKIGERFFQSKNKTRSYQYLTDILWVKCKCGIEYKVEAKSLISNKSKCRGCAVRKIELGAKFGKLTVESWYRKKNKSNRSQIWYHCKCECGGVHDVKSDVIKSGESNSCVRCRISNKFVQTTRKININRYMSSIKSRCKKVNLELSPIITIDFLNQLLILQNYLCKLSGLPISIELGTASLDRINNSIGYIPDNLQWVHRSVNFMKNELEQKEFIRLCHAISSYQNIHNNQVE